MKPHERGLQVKAPSFVRQGLACRSLQFAAVLLLWMALQVMYWRVSRVEQTLVVYVYADADPAYRENLEYFLRVGVIDNPRLHYVVIIQQDAHMRPPVLPSQYRNLEVFYHKNECYDLGTLGWFFNSELVDLTRFKYFIFLNASVRGPFLPAYWPEGTLWTDAFTDRLNGAVKLVGSTVNCGGVTVDEMTRVGLKVIRADTHALGCYDSKWRTIIYGELGISDAILSAGYNLDTLMLRYQGVDWRKRENWNCNAGINPFIERGYDGISVSPLEQMFVKVKADWVARELSAPSLTAVAYSRWKLGQKDIKSNAFRLQKSSDLWRIEALRLLNHHPCFDFEHYVLANPDLPMDWDDQLLWSHFVYVGQFESREFRFQCPMQYGLAGPRNYGEVLRASLNLGPAEDHAFNLGLGTHPELLQEADRGQALAIQAWELHLASGGRGRPGAASNASAPLPRPPLSMSEFQAQNDTAGEALAGGAGASTNHDAENEPLPDSSKLRSGMGPQRCRLRKGSQVQGCMKGETAAATIEKDQQQQGTPIPMPHDKQ